ncbi:ribbon-helix-helix domain-containing protein [Fischerella sp. PCC 9605]|uniref:ribbon-helix-helix domain-containing protein n=1 Tax=Fischerella sp. PCC 9605 TaxID=1173024 RepID=UPI0004B8971F|nr:hypothetical protein [Fischerella sp. PCC 9605]
MSKKEQYRITITLSKDLYLQLDERAKKEERKLANLGLYLLKLGLEYEKQQSSQGEVES